jgi:hypothetical protein
MESAKFCAAKHSWPRSFAEEDIAGTRVKKNRHLTVCIGLHGDRSSSAPLTSPVRPCGTRPHCGAIRPIMPPRGGVQHSGNNRATAGG